jgi:hypothetical protein
MNLRAKKQLVTRDALVPAEKDSFQQACNDPETPEIVALGNVLDLTLDGGSEHTEGSAWAAKPKERFYR